MSRKLLAILFAALALTTSGCDSLVEPEAPVTSSPTVASATLFSAAHYPASTDLSLPRIYIAGEQFDPFCDNPQPFSVTMTGDGAVITKSNLSVRIKPHCWSQYLSCNDKCRRMWNPRSRAVCWGACTSQLGICNSR